MSLFDGKESHIKATGILSVYPVDVQTVNTPGKRGQKPAHERPDVLAKHAAFAILREAGAGPSQAAKVLGYSNKTGTVLEKKLNAYELQRDNLLKISVKTLQNFAAGKPINQKLNKETRELEGGVTPKGSDVMRAVENIMDREQPKVTLTASVSAEFLPIDLNDYQ